jgi:NAD(P)-dependent dehydrogenase (short-subunit alcohol dehydrogenase family)
MTVTTPVRTHFGATTTAAEVVEGIDLSGRRALVTGGASGIGIETARALASAGAEVTLAVRNVDVGERTAADIVAGTGNARVAVARVDLADLGSVAAFVAAWDGPLHLLINNAGVMRLPTLQLSAVAWEMQLATNHLGHFALALGLHDALAAAGHARIVSLSSRAHLRSQVVFDDLNFTSRPYDAGLAYGQSKTANVLFAVEATRRWAAEGITANAVHPGAITATNLSRYMEPAELADIIASDTYTFKTVEQGAATSVLAATSPLLEGIGGRYLEDCNEAFVVDPSTAEFFGSGVAAYALDPKAAALLWEVSVETLAS